MVPVVYEEAYWTKYRCKGVTTLSKTFAIFFLFMGKYLKIVEPLRLPQRVPQQLDSNMRSR